MFFPRMKDPIIYEESQDRKVIWRRMVHLHNYQTSQVQHLGINQILNSFCDRDIGHYQNEQGINEDANSDGLLTNDDSDNDGIPNYLDSDS